MPEPPREEPHAPLQERPAGLLWAAAAGAWEVDYRTGRYYLADNIQRLLGDEPGYCPDFGDLREMARVHPDDRPLLRAVLEEAVATGSDRVEDCEFRIRHRDGSWVWLHTQAYILEKDCDGTPLRIAGWHTDVTERRRVELALAEATRQVERLSGPEFFETLACALSQALQVRYCLIGRLETPERIRTVGFAERGEQRPGFAYDLAGTPCAHTMSGQICVFPRGVAAEFPEDTGLGRLGVESYMGMGLFSSDGSACGLIALMDDKPMPQSGIARPLLPLFGARATVELERMAVRESQRASQMQYRLLFEHLITACALLEPVFAVDGSIVDFRYLDVNPAFLSMTRMDPRIVIGRTIREMIPHVEDYWIEGMAAVARGGQPVQFEQYSQDYNRWYELRAFQPEPGRVAILFNDITERRNIDLALRESERTLREMFENTQLAAILFDLEGRVTFCNESLLMFVGLPASEVVGQFWFERFLPAEEREEIFELLGALGGDWSGFPRHWRNHVLHVNGSKRLIEWDHSPVYDANGKLAAIAGLGRDLTAWEQLEEQYRQAQKMEAIGRLAGGVAHDFNNLLTVINGYAGLALARLAEGHAARPAIAEIQKAGDRAATLTRQLLAFSRKQLFRLRLVNVNDVVADAREMLARLVGPQIQVDCELEPRPGLVRADPGQVLQVLMNLAVNARDAISTSGRILIRTFNHRIGADEDPQFPNLRPGEYVGLMVADNGSGMDEETQSHMFEPFFTTKPPGEGTGLGLATVYGIVQQSGGAIAVRSRPGEGSVFRLLLPAAPGEAEALQVAAPVQTSLSEGSVLLVEDQDAVRDFLRTVLEESGFRVQTASCGEAALEALNSGYRPDLLISDIVMPGISGVELAAQARNRWPGLKVVLVSGYAPSRERPECDVYLEKPVTGDALLAALRGLRPARGG